MKQIHKITTLLIAIFCLVGLTMMAQDAKEGPIKVKIKTEENGVEKVFERTYSSKEEMEQDQELKELGFEGFDDPEMETIVLSKSIEESEEVQVDIKGEDEDGQIKVRKVIKDKDGHERVIEKVYDSIEDLEADEGMDVKVKDKGDEKEIIIKKEKVKGKKEKVSKTVEIEIEEELDDSDGKVKKKTIEVIEKKD